MAGATAEQTVPDAKCWTNPAGKVLTPIMENVWGAERPFMWNRIDVGGRGAVIRLSDGSLWTQSPVELTPELKRACDELGQVKHIVSPNYEHTAFAKQWKDAYPDAVLYGCPGLPDKEPEKGYDAEVGVNNQAPDSWLGEIEVTHLSYEAVPLLNKPFFNEVIFLHKSSGTLIVTDLFWSYPSDAPGGTKAWKVGMDVIYKPFYNRLMISNKEEYNAAMDRILNQWQWDAILPCHGTFIASGGKQQLQQHLNLPPPQLIRGR